MKKAETSVQENRLFCVIMEPFVCETDSHLSDFYYYCYIDFSFCNFRLAFLFKSCTLRDL